MAVRTDLRGFEDPPAGLDADLTALGPAVPTIGGANNGHRLSAGTAWGGVRFLRTNVTIAGPGAGVSYPPGTVPVTTSGQAFDYRVEVYFRIESGPSVDGAGVYGALLNCHVQASATRQLRMAGPNNAVGAWSVATLDTDVWYRLEIRHYGVTLTTGKQNSGRSRSTCDIFEAQSGLYLFTVASAPQTGTPIGFGGDQADAGCSALTGGVFPFGRANFTDAGASFATMQGFGLTGITVIHATGVQAFAFVPYAGSLIGPPRAETIISLIGGCFRGATDGTYTYIEQGLLTPFGETFANFAIDNGLPSNTWVLGQGGSGVSSIRDFGYDNPYFIVGTGTDVPTLPPPGPAPLPWPWPPVPGPGSGGCIVTLNPQVAGGGSGCVDTL